MIVDCLKDAFTTILGVCRDQHGGMKEGRLIAVEVTDGPAGLCEEMLDGEVGRGDDVLTDTLVVYLEPAGAVHMGGCGPDNTLDDLNVYTSHGFYALFCLRIASR